MVYTSIFGQNLDEYEIELLVDNGVGEANWAIAAQQIEMYNRYHRGQSVKGAVQRALKAAGIFGTGAAAAWRAIQNIAAKTGETERIGNLRGGKSFYNSPWGKHKTRETTS